VTLGAGLFTEILLDQLAGVLLDVRAVGIGQDLFNFDEAGDLANVEAILINGAGDAR